ncbi:hypothetical protein [Psychrobacter sp. FDAARGOS_221]|uniref:hypothetical protein n=1 Tax=Psychrobacter sp. FDAARGOS_221 TaxID=1975705 RepID=UPI000BB5475C|nr:hypothetical protein [Psychrobacter sp. FDAARGOS_221]PNK61140.1 hypothetical protein A6J60_009850 [Psychrobacter sp. FDAARGOS_221]
MIQTKSLKLMLWGTLFSAVIGLSACQKETSEETEPTEEAEVMMSAEPAEDNAPVIVADDLDEVDAQSEMAEEARSESDTASDIGLEQSSATPPPAAPTEQPRPQSDAAEPAAQPEAESQQ